MKKIYSLFTSLIFTSIILGQSPEKMTFQAVVRDASNALLINQNIGMQISIVQGSANGNSIYTETHTPISNDNGLVNLEIGTGTIVSGMFGSIDWSTGPYFIKTATDPTGATNYTISGTSQLMSVPYALYAKTSGNGAGPQGPAGPAGTNGIDGQDGAVGPQGNPGSPYVEPTYTIGISTDLGGYVFWVSADGKHGLVSETQDQGLATWYFAKDVISDPLNHSVDGQKFRDWRMPTKHELNEMYSASTAIGSFGTKTYWSSIRSGSTTAWRQNFLSGLQFNSAAYTISDFFFVRSVREF
jgi:hypothetical protein